MDIPNIPKYCGNIHPDEWINDIQVIQQYYIIRDIDINDYIYLNIAKSLVDSTISLPTEINSLEKLRNALKEDISFTMFKCINKRKLQLLKYIPERNGGDTLNFISNFRKLCFNAEIHDIKEQKKYFYQSLPNCDTRNYFLSEFFKRKEKINSMNDLIKEFGEIVIDELNLIEDGSIVALKHIATGKYLSSIKNLCYTTGSGYQAVFVGSPEPDPNSLWRIAYHGDFVNLQHIKSNMYLEIYKSPITEHAEVSCIGSLNVHVYWKFNHSKLDNHQGYFKSNDTINLSTSYNGKYLRSHDVQFTIGNETFQEVVGHNERLGGNDEWRIEVIKQNYNSNTY